MKLHLLTAFSLVLLPLAFAGEAQAQAPMASVLDGVYTNAQAQRGARTYQNICSHCHEGGEPDADPLFGQDFIDRWREAPLSYLHGFYSTNMPADEPGTLSAAVYVDVLAFLLKENGYPAGSELKAELLPSILLVGASGSQPLPANSLISVSGCLVDAGGDNWNLSAAAPLARIRRADTSTPAELEAAAALVPGDGTYQLRNAGDHGAKAAVGQKVQVKGVLNGQGASQALNVLALGSTGSSCE